jgi:hypothetical protein
MARLAQRMACCKGEAACCPGAAQPALPARWLLPSAESKVLAGRRRRARREALQLASLGFSHKRNPRSSRRRAKGCAAPGDGRTWPAMSCPRGTTFGDVVQLGEREGKRKGAAHESYQEAVELGELVMGAGRGAGRAARRRAAAGLRRLEAAAMVVPVSEQRRERQRERTATTGLRTA